MEFEPTTDPAEEFPLCGGGLGLRGPGGDRLGAAAGADDALSAVGQLVLLPWVAPDPRLAAPLENLRPHARRLAALRWHSPHGEESCRCGWRRVVGSLLFGSLPWWLKYIALGLVAVGLYVIWTVPTIPDEAPSSPPRRSSPHASLVVHRLEGGTIRVARASICPTLSSVRRPPRPRSARSERRSRHRSLRVQLRLGEPGGAAIAPIER